MYQSGAYNGGSFSYGSTVYSDAYGDSSTKTDSVSVTASDTSQNSETWSNAENDGGGSSSDVGSDSDNAAETLAISDSTSDRHSDAYHLYQAGVFGGGSYGLSSFSLSQQSGDTVTIDDVTSDSSVDTGSRSDDEVMDGYTLEDGSSSFNESGSSTETRIATSSNGFSLSQAGSFGGGSFALSNYAFSENQSNNVSDSKSGSDTDSFSGSNQSQSYSGSSSGSFSNADTNNNSGSLSQQGSFSNGNFSLNSVSYSGSGSDSFSNNASSGSSWSGGFSGSSGSSDDAVGSSSYTESATGCYGNGSFSLSSVSLSGNSSGSYTDTSHEQQTLNGVSSGETHSDAAQESDSLYQTGASIGGQFSNASYSYSDNSTETLTSSSQGPGYSNSDSKVTTDNSQETGSGTSGSETLTADTSDTYNNNGTPGSASSNTTTPTSVQLPSSPVSLAAPDATSVAGSSGQASGSSGSSSAAPVNASPSLAVVSATSQWLSGQGQTARQAVAQGESKAAQASLLTSGIVSSPGVILAAGSSLLSVSSGLLTNGLGGNILPSASSGGGLLSGLVSASSGLLGSGLTNLFGSSPGSGLGIAPTAGLTSLLGLGNLGGVSDSLVGLLTRVSGDLSPVLRLSAGGDTPLFSPIFTVPDWQAMSELGNNVHDFGWNTIAGWLEVQSPIPFNPPMPTTNVGKAGRLLGRFGGLVISSIEIVEGVGLIVSGAALLIGGGGGTVVTAGFGAPITIPVALVGGIEVAAGAVFTAHGVYGVGRFYEVNKYHPIQFEMSASGSGGAMRSPRYGNYVRRADEYKHALEPAHVKAARIEKEGGVVKLKPNGQPFDHLTETRNAMRGAKERITLLKKYLTDPELSPATRTAVQSELGELSKMLDNAERILGEVAK